MQTIDWANRPWVALSVADMAAGLAVPSMLSYEESQLYHWLGKRATGIGAVVDIGAFAGGSAARLLSGLAVGASTATLHAFDRFTAHRPAREAHLYPHGMPVTESDDILPLVEQFLSPWRHRLKLWRGDIATQRWTGEPLEIIAIDAGKSPRLTDHIAAEFLTCAVPGHSVIVHQDFLHASQPWLAVQMLGLQDQFKPVALVAKDCVVFECVQAVTSRALANSAVEGKTDADLIEGLRRAKAVYAPLVPPDRFLAMIRKIKANPGVRVAWKMTR